MKTLLFVLIAAVAIAAIAFYFYHKMNLAHQGHNLDWSDGDSVIVSEEDLQEFMFEMQAAEKAETQKDTAKTAFSGHHALA